ncbi:helicase RepA family protein [Candidatus Parcubacteria bacterium]|nr:helicase RepA family protein [Patescibacteria group bacterium]MBU4309683.1 helicase RepA family protein [Patescibacteria group bacterium]MBU4431693.1 helicase RepA family protein [Patescibacteria group bacterium]MBU4577929.1 helicase RepA family protein [Patescibacteria group bacterium]MCG2696562.1 helicase RepA family protein [Candidatus Parcubacteria bacterium]
MNKQIINIFFNHVKIPNTSIQLGEVNNIHHTIRYDEEFDFEEYINKHPSQNIYFLGGIKDGVTTRAKDADIFIKNYIALDFDIRQEMKKRNEECDDEILKRKANQILEQFKSSPELKDYSYALLSGNGLHVYYFCKPIKINDAEIFKLGLKNLIEFVRFYSPITADTACSNLARIFRIPGSVNQKNSMQTILMEFEFTLSNIIENILKLGKAEMSETSAIKDIHNARPPENNTYTAINNIPLPPIVCAALNLDYDGKKNFRANGDKKIKACFMSEKNQNIIISGGTGLFSDQQSGYNTFQFVKMINNFTNQQTFNWFNERYQHITKLSSNYKSKIDNDGGLLDETEELIIVTAKDILAKEPKEAPFIVDTLIPEGAVTAITAGSGKGKSLFMLILASHIATGNKLFGIFNTKKSKVLIIDQEMDEDIIVGRFKATIKENIAIDYIYNQAWKIDNEKNYEDLKEIIITNKYKVLVLDTFANIHNKQENDSGEMKRINNRMLKLIRDTTVTIIYLHHHRKEQNNQALSQLSSRGSTEIIAKVASHIVVNSKKSITDDNGMIRTKFTIAQEKSRRPSKFNKLEFETIYDELNNNTTWQYLGETNQEKYNESEIIDEIYKLLEESESMTFEEIKKGLKDNDFEIGDNKLRDSLKITTGKYLSKTKGSGKYHNTDYYSIKNDQ